MIDSELTDPESYITEYTLEYEKNGLKLIAKPQHSEKGGSNYSLLDAPPEMIKLSPAKSEG